mgnify:CR=1 FL=1
MEIPSFLLPPYSAISIVLLALGVSVGVSLVNRRTVDREKLKMLMEIKKEYEELLGKYRATGDKKIEKKLKRLEPKYAMAQREAMLMSMKPGMYTLIPLLVVFWLLRGAFLEIPLVRLPFPVPFIWLLRGKTVFADSVIGYLGLYILASFTFSTILQRALGLGVD